MEKKNKTEQEGVANQTPPDTVINPELRSLMAKHSVEGVIGACALFMKARGIKFDLSDLHAVASVITADGHSDPEIAKLYTLSSSINTPVMLALMESAVELERLRAANDPHLPSLIRVIASGEALSVMDANISDVMRIINEKVKKEG